MSLGSIVAAAAASHRGLMLQQGSILEGTVLHRRIAIPRRLCHCHSCRTGSLCRLCHLCHCHSYRIGCQFRHPSCYRSRRL
jgi:hypothetical protein